MQDIRQSIIEFPGTLQYSCFHLEHDGVRINDYVELSEVKGLTGNSTLTLVEDPYTEKDARLHFMRIRELIGASGDKTDIVSGMSAGISFFDRIGQNSTHDTISHESANQPRDGSSTHPMSGYNFSSPGDPTKLIPPTTTSPPKTLKSMSLSPWNPPPYHLRQRGHLIYLQVTTNEGEQYQITSHVGGFYVNKSSNSKFDPFPRSSPKDVSAHSLLSLLDQISPSFAASFAAFQDYSNQREPLATFALTNAIPVSPWLVSSPKAIAATHAPDITRSQESYLLSGMEYVETLRDWNEEFQSTRELPTDSVQEKVFRERLNSKLFADYNEAATRGAVLIARGEVAPLNPTEAKDAQIFVYNNIFFSFGADGAGTFTSEGGDHAARVATGKDVAGVKVVNQLDVKGLFTPGTVVVDYLGKRLVCQSIVPGIFKQRGPDEPQIDYGAVDGKEVVANNDKFTVAFQTLSESLRVKPHAVWDKEGKRHELVGNVETKGLIGTDGRKYVLDLYRITPLDIAWIDECWHELPLTTGTNMAHGNTAIDDAYPHRMSVLRMDLVLDLYRMKAIEYISKEKEKNRKESRNDHTKNEDDTNGSSHEDANSEEHTQKVSESEEKPVDLSNFGFALNGDVFNGQIPQTEEEKEQWAKDEADVREACAFLRDTVIPRLIHDLKEAEVGFPLDGASLTRLLHKRGINVRYIGKIVKSAERDGPRLSALKTIGIQDMVARAFKHITNRRLRQLPTPFASTCISHFLNCLLGSDFNSCPLPNFDESLQVMFSDADFSFGQMTPDAMRAEIKQQVASRFQYSLADNWHSEIKPPQLLREIALKLGLQLEAKEYHFSKTTNLSSTNGEHISESTNGVVKTPLVNGHAPVGGKKKKKGADYASPPSSVAAGPSKVSTTFVPEDIVNIVPIIKDAAPKSTMADEAFEAGKLSLSNDQKELGQELLLESLSLHEQIYGILHPEVARFYMNLSMLYYQLDEKPGAAEIARKAVIVAERTLGIDSVETILAYLNLGLYEHAIGNTRPALAYVRHALELWKIVYGAKHPDSITTTNNAAVMLQHLKHYHDSRLWFEESLTVSEEMFGKDSENTATLLFQLAQALVLDHDSKASVKRMREAYNIFLTRFGPEDRNTKEAENWLEQLTQNAVSIAKHAKDLQTRKLRRVQLNPRVTLGTRTQPQVGQSSTSDQTELSTNEIGLDSRSVEELIKFIEGGGDPSKMGQKKKKTNSRSNPKRRGGAAVSAPA